MIEIVIVSCEEVVVVVMVVDGEIGMSLEDVTML